MHDTPPEDWLPPWKLALLFLAGALAWPVVAAPGLWRTWRFQRVARRAIGWKYRLVTDGVEVWKVDEAPRRLSWARLREARWLVHSYPTLASGAEELYAADLPEEGVALSGYPDVFSPLLVALAERGIRPEMENGGRALGAAGWLMTMLWLGMVALAAGLLHAWS